MEYMESNLKNPSNLFVTICAKFINNNSLVYINAYAFS